MKHKIAFFIGFILALSFSNLLAQDTLKTVTPDDYEKWESLSQTAISVNGEWVSYLVARENHDTLYIKGIENDSLYKFAFGSRVQFSMDSKWAAIRMGFSKKKMDQMKEKKQPVQYNLSLINLETGKMREIDKISSFTFSKKSNFICCKKYKVKGSTAKGDNIVLFDLNTEDTRTLGNVKQYAINKKGDYFAYLTETSDKFGNSAELFNLNDYTTKILDSDTLSYTKLTWEKEGNALAFMKELISKDFEETGQTVYAVNDLYGKMKISVFDPLKNEMFPDSSYITDKQSLTWSEDLSQLFFSINSWTKKEKKDKKKADKKDIKQDSISVAADSIKADSIVADKVKPKEKPKAKAKKDEKLPGVDIWHWNDTYIQPRQKNTYSRDKNFAHQSVWNIETNHFLQIGNDSLRSVRITGDQKYALCNNKIPYQPAFRLTYADYYLTNLSTGKQEMLLKEFTGYIAPSPDGKYILYFKDKNWHTYDIANKKHINLTGDIDTDFWDTRDDHPAEVRPSYGMGGWLKDDKMVYLNDEYDVWAIKPDGSAYKNISNGTKKEIRYRIRPIDREYDYFDPKKPLYFSVFGDKTKKSGFASMKVGGKITDLIYQDKLLMLMGKAKESDKFIFTSETYTEPTSLKYTDATFVTPKTVAETNKHQSEYAWGKTELVEFTNKLGKKMQGSLHYPAGYEEGKEYPMLVYIYERLSDRIHGYVKPSKKSFYNTTNYVQQGYFVFKPDIVYELNDPGISAVNCVVPAVEKVLATGMIDKNKVGIMGHSWGAYQTAFLITQTNLFSAAVAGAPLTDLISMYTEVYWNTGNSNQGIFETSQGRFTKPYWEQMDKYIANSPMFNAQNIKTPLLVAFGDKDGAVDWHQGIELYTTMRRMQKEMIMLVYADENHAVRKEENMLDYTKKINEFYDHHLLGKKAEKWITEGISYKEKKEKEEKVKKKK